VLRRRHAQPQNALDAVDLILGRRPEQRLQRGHVHVSTVLVGRLGQPERENVDLAAVFVVVLVGDASAAREPTCETRVDAEHNVLVDPALPRSDDRGVVGHVTDAIQHLLDTLAAGTLPLVEDDQVRVLGLQLRRVARVGVAGPVLDIDDLDDAVDGEDAGILDGDAVDLLWVGRISGGGSSGAGKLRVRGEVSRTMASVAGKAEPEVSITIRVGL